MALVPGGEVDRVELVGTVVVADGAPDDAGEPPVPAVVTPEVAVATPAPDWPTLVSVGALDGQARPVPDEPDAAPTPVPAEPDGQAPPPEAAAPAAAPAGLAPRAAT